MASKKYIDQIHVTTGSGKMKDVPSINTPSSENKFCAMMSKTDSVCASCYALRMEGFRKNMVPTFSRNAEMLTSNDFQAPRINAQILRFHSYGELINTEHLKSFIKIAKANKHTTFALWTKRANIVQGHIRNGGKVPKNMILVYSNPTVDYERKTPPKGFDKVFNVHTKEGIEENEIKINCGAKSCNECRTCYSRRGSKVINEQIKK